MGRFLSRFVQLVQGDPEPSASPRRLTLLSTRCTPVSAAYSYAPLKPSISGPHRRRTAPGRVVLEAPQPMNERTRALCSCQQGLADTTAVAQPIHGSAAFIGGLSGGHRGAIRC